MNKKFFAALTSAAMLLGSPVGVLEADERTWSSNKGEIRNAYQFSSEVKKKI